MDKPCRYRVRVVQQVETRPRSGYPRRYEDQEKWKGGWVLNKRGRLELKSGNRFQKLFSIFASPIQPELSDYYEPWTTTTRISPPHL